MPLTKRAKHVLQHTECRHLLVSESTFVELVYKKGRYFYFICVNGAQWLSGRVLDSRPKGRGFEPNWRHYVVVLEQDTLILA